MKKLLPVLIILLISLNCGSNDEKLNTADLPSVLLTKVLSFGSEGVPDEYILAQPRGVAVDKDGNIYVADENRIKVYDEDGMEIRILGSPGQGPGEFEIIGGLTISPTGLITAKRDFFLNSFNLYDSDGAYLKSFRTGEDKMLSGVSAGLSIASVYSDNEIVFNSSVKEENPGKHVHHLLYLNHKLSDKNRVFAKLSQISCVRLETGSSWTEHSARFQGNLFWRSLPGRKIIYSHSRSEVISEQNKNYYLLHLYSLDTGETTTIKKEYNRRIIPEKYYTPGAIDRWLNRIKPINQIELDLIKSYPYFEPFKNILADGNTIFVFTDSWNDKKEAQTDIFDAEKSEYIKSVYFPGLGEYNQLPDVINNGKAYYINSGKESFTVLDVYSIDKSVYQK
jgi:hypothetical protein